MRCLSVATSCCLVSMVAGSRDVWENKMWNSTSASSDACKGDDFGTAGEFGYYVFQQSWPAEFCFSHNYPGCQNPTEEMRANLTIHGLWPNYNSPEDGHNWPQCCPNKQPYLEQTTLDQLENILDVYWPNEQNPHPTTSSAINSSLWSHEWGKHGTCSGVDQIEYFESSLQVHKNINTPAIIRKAAQSGGGSVDRTSLEKYYTGSSQGCVSGSACMVGIGCSGNYLSDITTCWTTDLQPMECPWSTLSSSANCFKLSSVKISTFNSTNAGFSVSGGVTL